MKDFLDINFIFPNGLGVDAALDLLVPVAIYVIGMAVYAVFIFKFYRFLASRDMFDLDFSKYEESRFKLVRGFLHLVSYGAKYIILFPAFAFFWFAVLTLILVFLSQDRAFSEVLLIALATVSAIRLTAYYDEDLSRDLAKILPFAVLAIFLIDGSFFEVDESLQVLKEVNNHRERIVYYLVFLIALEFALRLILSIAAFLISERNRLLRRRSAAAIDSEAAPPPEEPTPPEEEEAGDESPSAP